MTQKIEYRINYHPDIRSPDNSDRKVKGRLSSIINTIDVRDKIILDLGCSGGYFSFSLAKYAKKVIAVDADEEIIKRNKQIQSEYGINNIEFICGNITSKLIKDLPNHIDVVLLLSVFHHILTGSEAYDWNSRKSFNEAFDLIKSINKKTRSLIFEMGLPNEGYEWCGKLPFMGNNSEEWDKWIRENIFNKSFSDITRIKVNHPPNNLSHFIIQKLIKNYSGEQTYLNKIKSIFKYDARDYRPIYIGSKTKLN